MTWTRSTTCRGLKPIWRLRPVTLRAASEHGSREHRLCGFCVDVVVEAILTQAGRLLLTLQDGQISSGGFQRIDQARVVDTTHWNIASCMRSISTSSPKSN